MKWSWILDSYRNCPHYNPEKGWAPWVSSDVQCLYMQRTVIDRCALSLSLQRAIELLMFEWHIWFCYTATRKAFGIEICTIHLCCSCLFPYQASHTESWAPPLKPRTKISGKLNQEKKQFQIFQYYMITLCFPLFQSDQSMHLCDSNSLVLLTEESYSGKTLVAWVNNSVLERAEQIGSVVPLCFPTALPLSLREYTTCVLGMRGGGSDGREETLQLLTVSHCFVSLFLTST